MTEHIIEDKELGLLYVRVNARAKSLVFRTRKEGIFVSVPPGTMLSEVEKAIEELRPRLVKAKLKQVYPLIDLNYRIDAGLFKLHLITGGQKRFLLRSEGNEMQIVCPSDTDFSNPDLQDWLRKVIEEALRKKAKLLLPSRLHLLSVKHHLSYNSVKINSSSGRWGSCSAQKNINLSFYILLLPEHLVDYVLLHELAHTREMNHGVGFWALLNKMTDGEAYALRGELKKYKTEI